MFRVFGVSRNGMSLNAYVIIRYYICSIAWHTWLCGAESDSIAMQLNIYRDVYLGRAEVRWEKVQRAVIWSWVNYSIVVKLRVINFTCAVCVPLFCFCCPIPCPSLPYANRFNFVLWMLSHETPSRNALYSLFNVCFLTSTSKFPFRAT